MPPEPSSNAESNGPEPPDLDNVLSEHEKQMLEASLSLVQTGHRCAAMLQQVSEEGGTIGPEEAGNLAGVVRSRNRAIQQIPELIFSYTGTAEMIDETNSHMQEATRVLQEVDGVIEENRSSWRRGLAAGFLCAMAAVVGIVLAVTFVF